MWPIKVNCSKSIEEMPSTSTFILDKSNLETQKMVLSIILGDDAMTKIPMSMLGCSSNQQIQETVVSSASLSDLAHSQKSSETVSSKKTTPPIDELSHVSPPKKCKKTPRKKASTSQKKKHIVRTKKTMEKHIQDFIDKCEDKELLRDLVLEAMDVETSHPKYKEKNNDFIETKLSKESSTLANAKRDHSAEKLSSLQKIQVKYVEDLCNVCGDDFKEIMINTFIANSNASRVMELFNIEEIKQVLCTKYSDAELYDLFIVDKLAHEKILQTAPDNMIIDLVASRDDLKRSQALLDILIKNSAQNLPEELNSNLDNDAIVKSELVSPIANLVKSRKDFNTDSCLLDVVLQNGPEVLSEENMNNLKTFLQNKVGPQRFLNLSHEVSTFHMKKKNHVLLQLPKKTEQNNQLVEID